MDFEAELIQLKREYAGQLPEWLTEIELAVVELADSGEGLRDLVRA